MIKKILCNVPGKKLLKVPFIIHADLECILEKMNACSNNATKSYTEKKVKHIALGYSMITCCSFDESNNEEKYYRGEHCMKKFCDNLKEQAIKIMSYEQKGMMPLTDEEKESHKNQQFCHICEKEFCTDKKDAEFKLKQKVRDHCHYTGKYRGAAHSICNLRYKVKKEIPVVFHNGSVYGYHLIIKQIAKEFKGHFDCLGENTEKYITFSVPIQKEINDNNNDDDDDDDNNTNIQNKIY